MLTNEGSKQVELNNFVSRYFYYNGTMRDLTVK